MDFQIELHGWARLGRGDGGESYHYYQFNDEEYDTLYEHLTMLVEKDGDKAYFDEHDLRSTFPEIYDSMEKFITAKMIEELREWGIRSRGYEFGFHIDGDLIRNLM